MSLTVLTLETMLLIRELLVELLAAGILHHLRSLVHSLLLKTLLIHLGQLRHGHLQVGDERIAAATREVLSNDHTQHLQSAGIGSHGVCWDNPATLTQLVGDRELVKLVAVLGIQAESDQRETVALGLGHEREAHALNCRSKVISRPSEVEHDATVALFAQSDELVVLPNNLACSAGEVQSKRGLVSSQVVDVEDELCKRLVPENIKHCHA